MKRKKLIYYGTVLLSLTVVLVLAFAACTSPTPTPTPAPSPTPTPAPSPSPSPTPSPTPPPTPTPTPTPIYTIMTRNDPGIGEYLVDGKGMTLYYFTKDTEGMSNASDAIIANWPIFYVDSINVSSNLNASDFGTITRKDGKMQTTYKGWPLYYFAKDMAPGDMMGQGVNDVWFVVNPQSFMPPKMYPLVSGWYQDRQVQYYDFGTGTPLVNGKVLTAPIYALITGMDAQGNPQFVSGQHNIVDVIPGDEGYSDLWQVNLVTVPQDYTAETLRSAADVMSSGYPMQQTDILVNCPIVPPGSTTETGIPLTQGWYKGQKVYYFDFGPNPDIAAPIYALITGMDAQGNPQFVSGQHNIIDVVPGDNGYSAFWLVNLVTVPQDYAAETLKSFQAVMASGYPMTETDIMVNCPVVNVSEAGSPQNGGTTQSVTIDLVAKSFAFDKSTIIVPAGASVTINFDNQDSAPHNFALYSTSSAQDKIFVGKIITGPSSTVYEFTSPAEPGDYFFRCDVHPTTMTGTFVVEAP